MQRKTLRGGVRIPFCKIMNEPPQIQIYTNAGFTYIDKGLRAFRAHAKTKTFETICKAPSGLESEMLRLFKGFAGRTASRCVML